MTGRAVDSHVPLNDVVAQAVSAHVSESYCPSQTIARSVINAIRENGYVILEEKWYDALTAVIE